MGALKIFAMLVAVMLGFMYLLPMPKPPQVTITSPSKSVEKPATSVKIRMYEGGCFDVINRKDGKTFMRCV